MHSYICTLNNIGADYKNGYVTLRAPFKDKFNDLQLSFWIVQLSFFFSKKVPFHWSEQSVPKNNLILSFILNKQFLNFSIFHIFRLK